VVDVQVYALRQKLRSAGLDRAIQTVRGVGYRLGRSP
jgi:DNA-binding response OmpR family regulator